MEITKFEIFSFNHKELATNNAEDKTSETN